MKLCKKIHEKWRKYLFFSSDEFNCCFLDWRCYFAVFAHLSKYLLNCRYIYCNSFVSKRKMNNFKRQSGNCLWILFFLIFPLIILGVKIWSYKYCKISIYQSEESRSATKKPKKSCADVLKNVCVNLAEHKIVSIV